MRSAQPPTMDPASTGPSSVEPVQLATSESAQPATMDPASTGPSSVESAQPTTDVATCWRMVTIT